MSLSEFGTRNSTVYMRTFRRLSLVQNHNSTVLRPVVSSGETFSPVLQYETAPFINGNPLYTMCLLFCNKKLYKTVLYL